MERDKLALPFGGGTLLEWVARRLAGQFQEVILVGDHEVRGFRTVRDRWPERGPLVGLHSALSAAGRRIFLCGGDMPYVNVRMVTRMARFHEAAVVPRLSVPQPLHAWYSIECLPVVEELLRSGERSLQALLQRVLVRWVEEAWVRFYDPQLMSHRSVNTPPDYEAAVAWLRHGE